MPWKFIQVLLWSMIAADSDAIKIESNEIPPWPSVSDRPASSYHSRRFQHRHQLLQGTQGFPEGQGPKELWFHQDLNHFNPTDDRQWQQRYFVNSSFHRPGKGPAFLMIGGEGEANPAWMTQGTWIDYAKQFGAICFMLEHRFYGKSHPTQDMGVKNLVYLSSEQALADLAKFVEAMSVRYGLQNSKWIAFGGSYPGSLAAWLRLKFPHLVHGAVSTSGPLLAKADFYEYLQVVSRSLSSVNGDCDPALREALGKVDVLTEHRIGWNMISKDFKLCSPFDGKRHADTSMFFEMLVENFMDVVQYSGDNREFEGVKNSNVTIGTICDIMTNRRKDSQDSDTPAQAFLETLLQLNRDLQAAHNGEDLNKAFASLPRNLVQLREVLNGGKSSYQRLVDLNAFILSMNGEECMEHRYESMVKEASNTSWSSSAGVGFRQWLYQTCTEFGWYQSSDQPDHPYGQHFPLSFMEKQCQDVFGPKFNLKFLDKAIRRTNVNYGAKGIEVTNVVFVHGAVDPWHAMGITSDLSSVATAILIPGAAHCANMYPERSTDSPQLKHARKAVAVKIKQWLDS